MSAQVSVDSFFCTNAYVDVATCGCLSRYTSGQVFHYPGFSYHADRERLSADIVRSVTREMCWEAVMRVRCTTGLRASNFYGNFFIRGTDLLGLPNVNSDTAFNVELKHDEALPPTGVVGIQAALLYTTSEGERRIRVHTMQVPVTTALADVFRDVDIDALCNLLSKMALDNALRTGIASARRYLHRSVVDVVRAYRNAAAVGYAPSVSVNPLGLPECLGLLPLYSMALQRSTLYRGATDIRVDERASMVYRMLSMSTAATRRYIYPSLYPLHDMGEMDGRPLDADEPRTDAAGVPIATMGSRATRMPNVRCCCCCCCCVLCCGCGCAYAQLTCAPPPARVRVRRVSDERRRLPPGQRRRDAHVRGAGRAA